MSIGLFGGYHEQKSLSEYLQHLVNELTYTVTVVLRGELKSQIYDNFMLLSVGVYFLVNSEYCLRMNDLANSILLLFVEHFAQLNGQEFEVYNFHGLMHLCEDAKAHGNLDLF